MDGIRIAEQTEKKTEIVAKIMSQLKDWFGLPDVNARLAAEAVGKPMWVAYRGAKPVGFVTLVIANQWSAELDVLGVIPEEQRKGTGARLIAVAEEYLKQKGVHYLALKTIADSDTHEGFVHTRAFYRKVGFVSLMDLPTLWNAENPCLVMVKYLK